MAGKKGQKEIFGTSIGVILGSLFFASRPEQLNRAYWRRSEFGRQLTKSRIFSDSEYI